MVLPVITGTAARSFRKKLRNVESGIPMHPRNGGKRPIEVEERMMKKGPVVEFRFKV
jgi:hypothetical protein